MNIFHDPTIMLYNEKILSLNFCSMKKNGYFDFYLKEVKSNE